MAFSSFRTECISAPILFITLLLLIFSVVPMYECSWVYGWTPMSTQNCQLDPSCNGHQGSVNFQILVNPFYANMLFNSASLPVMFIPWSMFNGETLCTPGSLIYENYGKPSGLCVGDNRYATPSALTTTQTMVVLTIIFAFVSLVTALCSSSLRQSSVAFACYFIFMTCTFIFSTLALSAWDSFSVTKGYLQNGLNAAPMYNATIFYIGQQYVRNYGWESAYSYTPQTELAPTEAFNNARTSNGYNLWGSAIFFLALSEIVALIACCFRIRERLGFSKKQNYFKDEEESERLKKSTKLLDEDASKPLKPSAPGGKIE